MIARAHQLMMEVKISLFRVIQTLTTKMCQQYSQLQTIAIVVETWQL